MWHKHEANNSIGYKKKRDEGYLQLQRYINLDRGAIRLFSTDNSKQPNIYDGY